MKRLGIWLFYLVGAAAVGYLALYAYVMLTGRDMTPGDPIRIFRRPDAPSYSRRDAGPELVAPAAAIIPPCADSRESRCRPG